MSPSTPHIVITGGTRGIGRALALALLEKGCRVTICGRSPASVEAALSQLGSPETLFGMACDVAEPDQVARLWERAEATHGQIDIWINNAGTANPQSAFVEQRPETIASVVGSNLLGTMYGTRVALEAMLARGQGHIFNMEGFGADGSLQSGMALYGSTKRALRYFSRATAREVKGSGVAVCTLSPGVVVTDLLIGVYANGDPENWRRQRWLFKFIADPAEVVCPWLADQVLERPRNGAHIAWMTVPKAILRALQPRYHRRDLFAGRLPPE